MSASVARTTSGRAPVQGQSLVTIDKIRGIGSALAIGMRTAAARFAWAPYHHADTNAGSGMNEEVSRVVGEPVPGSPVVAVRTADAVGLKNFRGMFCEIDAERARTLANSHLRGRPNCFVFCGDNAEFIEVFAESIRRSGDKAQYAVGSIIVDPNGWFRRNKDGSGVPVAELVAFTREFPRVDVVLNLNVRTYHLMRGHGDKFGAMGAPEIMSALGKEHWLLSPVRKVGGDKFVLMIGRNFPTGDHRRLGLCRVDSVEGRAVLQEIEAKRQGALPL
jgi:hypothetical protein